VELSFEIEPLEGAVGAEISGLDLDMPIDEVTRRALYEAWVEAGILVFRGIGTSAERHLALSRCFGALEVHPVPILRLARYPEIISLNNTGDTEPIIHYFDGKPIADQSAWHTDTIFTPSPCRAGVLRMVHKSETGGETGWIDTAAAYDALSESMKQRIENLEARFDFVVDLCDMRFGRFENLRHGDMGSVQFPELPTVIHNIVWTHPESGRKSLNLSPLHLTELVDMSRSKGDAILEDLVNHTIGGPFTYVHDWEEGDMVLWDNWRTMHRAFGIPPHCEREVQRTTINSERVIGRLA
jgi:taurine dioxygenase